jgi:hypothetical protein
MGDMLEPFLDHPQDLGLDFGEWDRITDVATDRAWTERPVGGTASAEIDLIADARCAVGHGAEGCAAFTDGRRVVSRVADTVHDVLELDSDTVDGLCAVERPLRVKRLRRPVVVIPKPTFLPVCANHLPPKVGPTIVRVSS